ncbi:MAG: DUF2156 domain-containing protein [Proteobacteria bacterium]|nr:DUF2156 domain-containing protein [Pseudomonadota bacterium]
MNFEILEPNHYKLLKPFFLDQTLELSVFSLASVIAWRYEDNFQVRFAVTNDTLFMIAENPRRPNDNYLALPLPTNRFGPKELSELARELGLVHFNFVPGAYIDRYGLSRVEQFFHVNEQDEFTDYVYKTEDLVQLDGHRYAKKRNLIRQFEREYVVTDRVRIEQINREAINECLDFVERWYLSRGREQGSDDMRAAYCAIEEFTNLELTGILARIDGTIVGIGTCARLTEDMGVLNLEMAFHDVKGLYQYLDRECARRMFLGRFEYLNKESDMGIPGLRQSKRSYYPIKYVTCYRLSVLH